MTAREEEYENSLWATFVRYALRRLEEGPAIARYITAEEHIAALSPGCVETDGRYEPGKHTRTHGDLDVRVYHDLQREGTSDRTNGIT
jgi:hypothetical protein